MNNINDAISKLASFGLSEVESRLYLYILGKEPLTIVQIAHGTNLPRTTLYDNVQKLIEKGLVEKVVIYKSQMFKAHPISILKDQIARQTEQIKKLEISAIELENMLPLATTQTTSTQVRYFHGPAGFKQMMSNTLNAEKETIGYSEFGRVTVVGEKFMEYWKTEMISKNIKDRVITSDNPKILSYVKEPTENYWRRQFQNTKIIDNKSFYISGDTTIYNNIFAVCWWKSGEVVGVEIENPELVKIQKSIFEILWKIAKPIASMP
jgi:sugar-specific transcriptional regulator TrmB